MMQPLFVDTGGWIAYFDKSDNAHMIFKDCLSRAIRGTDWRLHTSDYIIDETVMNTLLLCQRKGINEKEDKDGVCYPSCSSANG